MASIIDSRMLAKTSSLSAAVMNVISPLDVVGVLNRNRISFVLLGAYGLASWMKKPRSTEDVDVMVAARQHKKAVRLLLAAFASLEADEHHVVTRLRDKETKDVAIDVMQPNQQLFRVVFKHTKDIDFSGQRCRIPTLEMALAMKFAAMISLHRRDADKHQDAHDFIRIVDVNPDINFDKLTLLGDLVYPGGGAEIVAKVQQVRAGEKLLL